MAALAGGYRVAYAVAAALVFAALLVALGTLPRRPAGSRPETDTPVDDGGRGDRSGSKRRVRLTDEAEAARVIG